jgi:hypothetical protein
MKQIILWCLLSIVTNVTMAQDKGKKADVDAVIVAFITKKLNLTVAEAQDFWPVFNNYKKEVKATNNETDEIKRSEAVLNIQKKYKPQFQKILNSETRANNTFKVHRDLMQRLKQIGEHRKAKMQRKGQPV